MSVSTESKWELANRVAGDLHYLVELPNGDRMELPEKELQRIYGFADRRRDVVDQFRELFQEIDSWVDRNLEKIDRVVLAFTPEGVDFLVVQRGKAFDRDFNKSLSQFGSTIARDGRFDLIGLNEMVLPYCDDQMARPFIGPTVLVRRVAEVDGQASH